MLNIREATHEWVGRFSAIPYGLVVKLVKHLGYDEIHEITPPSKGDSVYIYSGKQNNEYGCISSYLSEKEMYIVKLENNDTIEISQDDFEVERDNYIPMWGTMWAFGENLDNYWLEDSDNLQAMADCGFRIYEQEDYGFIFGIDGAGYDFYSEHWVPLY